MKKKIFALAMAAVMLVGVLAGCAPTPPNATNGSEDSGSISSNPTFSTDATFSTTGGNTDPITMVAVLNQTIPLDKCDAFQWSLQDGKYNFKVESYERTILKEKVNLMLNTNQYPDAFIKCSWAIKPIDVDKYGSMGIFIPLNDLISKYAPNMCKYLEAHPEVMDYITSADGNIYSIPGFGKPKSAQWSDWINQTWLDRLGLEMPHDMESLYNVLHEFKVKDANGNGDPNDEYPWLVQTTPAGAALSFMKHLGHKFYKQENVVVKDDGTLQEVHTTEGYKEALKWVTKMYAEGIIDSTMFTSPLSAVQAIGKGGDVVGMTGASSPATYCGNIYGLNFSTLPCFHEDIAYIDPGVNVPAIVITDHCKNPEVIVEWADQFYSEEGAIRAWMGVEGVNWKYTDAEKTKYEWILKEGQGVSDMRSQATLQGIGFIPAIEPPIYSTGNSNPLEIVRNDGIADMLKHSKDYFPKLPLTADELKEISTYWADIMAYIDTYAGEVVTGAKDLDSTWDAYLAKLKDMGLQEMMDIKQDAYNQATKK